jgi:beta-phosphoglucomutase-like phosphatase (HAD superfamily)
MKLTDLKAVFFDLDNVLVFSEWLHFKAWQATVPQFGVAAENLEYHKMTGISDVTQAEELIQI